MAEEQLMFSTTPIYTRGKIIGTGFFFRLTKGKTYLVTALRVIMDAYENVYEYEMRKKDDWMSTVKLEFSWDEILRHPDQVDTHLQKILTFERTWQLLMFLLQKQHMLVLRC
jgi:hypothetical protein